VFALASWKRALPKENEKGKLKGENFRNRYALVIYYV